MKNLLLLGLLFSLIFPEYTLSHASGGPPFVTVNGEISFAPFSNSPSIPYIITETKVPYLPILQILTYVAVGGTSAFLIFLFLQWRMKTVT